MEELKDNKLIGQVVKLKYTDVSKVVNKRLKDFDSFKNKSREEWFSELCFCLLTANSKAKTALDIQEELGPKGFCNDKQEDIRDCIKEKKHRFHNNKSKYIVEARQFMNVKDVITKMAAEKGEMAAREWLAENVNGLGYKESSHFMRNVGYKNLAILDRHIINLMADHGFIDERPKSLSKKKYLEFEEKFNILARYLDMKPAELDMYMWYMKTGEVLK